MNSVCLCTGRTGIRCGPNHCDLAGPSTDGRRHECRICWKRLGQRQSQRQSTPCRHLGTETGRTVECPSCNPARRVRLKLLSCAVHGECTPQMPLPGVACCAGCPDWETPPPAPLRWVSTADLAAASIRLAALLPPDVSGVAGIPRSGMIPASIIATHLHLPLYELAADGPRRLAAGSRGGTLHSPSGPLAVIDDTVYGGAAVRRARSLLRGRPALFAAVYVRPEAAGAVDLYAEPLHSPHLLEWNLSNNGPMAGLAANPIYRRGLAFDLDGVLVHDEQSAGKPGTPYLVPRAHPVRLIATGRHERHRPETEALLRKLGVYWERLEMLEDSMPLTAENAAEHKARHFRDSGCGFFVESCPVQAELIHALTGLPVICPRAGKVLHAQL